MVWLRYAQRLRWHHWMRLLAASMLVDQAVGTVTAIQPDTTVVLACFAALFAPVPTEKAP